MLYLTSNYKEVLQLKINSILNLSTRVPTRGFKNTPLLQRPVFTSLYWLLVTRKKVQSKRNATTTTNFTASSLFPISNQPPLVSGHLEKRIETGRIEFFLFLCLHWSDSLSVSSKVQIHEKTDRPGKKHGLL